MSVVFLKLWGALLLVLAGTGGGISAAVARRTRWQQAQRFAMLLEYLWQAVRYRALPAQEVLAMAALRTEFSDFGLENCTAFSQIRPPAALRGTMEAELQSGLRELEYAPRESACRTLQYLAALCRDIERRTGEEARRALKLYPRLGGCLGLLAAILLS